MIPLTLRAMNSIPHLQARSSARPSFALLSVLALLALACFPVLAQAQDATGVQYETEGSVPTVTGHTTPPKNSGGSPADPSNGGATATGSGSSNASGSGSAAGGPSANGNPSTGGGGDTGQGNSGNGSTTANGKGNGQQAGSLSSGQPASSQTSADDSSSPLIPILIAIATLAAISIGVVVIRQRRQRQDPGAQVSPKAS
jgi:cobalamin biosynthesis Mg chelatase CobN